MKAKRKNVTALREFQAAVKASGGPPRQKMTEANLQMVLDVIKNVRRKKREADSHDAKTFPPLLNR